MMSESDDSTDELTAAEQRAIWRQRAGNVMIGHYAADEAVNIVGLTLNRVSGDSDIWEVYEQVEDDYRYIDTINVSQFATASQLVTQLSGYYPDEDEAENVEPREETEESTPGRSYQ
jgi:hypothetical protein